MAKNLLWFGDNPKVLRKDIKDRVDGVLSESLTSHAFGFLLVV